MKSQKTNNKNNLGLENHYTDELINSNNNQINSQGYSRVPQNEEQQLNNQPGFFSRFVIKPLAYIGSFFCSKCINKKIDRGNEDGGDLNLNDLVLKDIPGRVDNHNEFNNLVKSKVGILIFYNSNQIQEFRSLVADMNKEDNSYLKEILIENFVNFSVKVDSQEGKRVSKIILL